MRAAYYEKNGAAPEVLRVGEVETPRPGPGESGGRDSAGRADLPDGPWIGAGGVDRRNP